MTSRSAAMPVPERTADATGRIERRLTWWVFG
jgi:hypothetical protein